MKKQSTFKMKGPGKKSPTKAIGSNYMEGFKKMTTKQLFDVVKRNDRGLESGRKEIVKRTQERGDANSIYQAMTANDSTNAAKRVIQQRIQKGTFDDGSLKKGENPFKLRSGNKPSIAKLSGVVETRQDNTRAPNVRTDIVVDKKAEEKRKSKESSDARRKKTRAELEHYANLDKYRNNPTPELYKKIQAYRKKTKSTL